MPTMEQHLLQQSVKTKRWHVFYTSPRAEKKCEERLLEARIEPFLPKVEIVRQWKDRKKKVEEPLFRSYIFAHVNERERLWTLQTPGIVRCLAFGGVPATVSEEEIEQLKIAQNAPERLAVVDGLLPRLGKVVRVEEGPLCGLLGEVLEYRGQTHVVIRVAAIRQAVRVHVAAEWVREVPSAPRRRMSVHAL